MPRRRSRRKRKPFDKLTEAEKNKIRGEYKKMYAERPSSSTSRASSTAGRILYPQLLPKGVNGRSLCRFCHEEIPKRRRTFCSDECVDQHKLRTNPGYLRKRVYRRDRGVCAACGMDTVELESWLRETKAPKATWIRQLGAAQSDRRRRGFWDADHILPVFKGGGECDLSNVRSLCILCHRERHRSS